MFQIPTSCSVLNLLLALIDPLRCRGQNSSVDRFGVVSCFSYLRSAGSNAEPTIPEIQRYQNAKNNLHRIRHRIRVCFDIVGSRQFVGAENAIQLANPRGIVG